jgi:hypothetical protein
MTAKSDNGSRFSEEAEATIAFAEKTIARITFAVLALAVFSASALYWPAPSGKLLPWAIALALGLAAMLSGGVIGLLFAVPRRGNDGAISGNGYVGNDNLVKVSDWLTGALTGIALATGKDMAKAIWDLSERVMPEQPGFVCACVVTGFAAGFLLAYLRLRANLEFIFAFGTRRANEASEAAKDAALERDAERKLAENRHYVGESAKAAGEPASSSARDRVLSIRKRYQSHWESDPHLGKFGACSKRAGFELRVARWQVGADAMLGVDLEVRATGSSLPTVAEFHLHPSFPQSVVSKPAESDGVVRLHIEVYETFVVGVVVQPGAIRLELDLNKESAIPAEYRTMQPAA